MKFIWHFNTLLYLITHFITANIEIESPRRVFRRIPPSIPLGEEGRIVKVRRDRDGRREIWFRNKNRILGITRIGEAIWSPRGAKWTVRGCRGEGARGREETYRYGEALRQRNTEERIIAGKPTTLRRPTPAPVPTAYLPSPSSGHTREEIALLITPRNVLFRALCNIASLGILRLR